VRKVRALRGYRLSVEFSDGTKGIANLAKHVQKEPFHLLRDIPAFQYVVIERGEVSWPEGDVRIGTEALQALVHEQASRPTTPPPPDSGRPVSLRELRRIAGKTQASVACDSGITQGALSRFENALDHTVSALRQHVSRLGGELEIVAVINGRRYPLHGC